MTRKERLARRKTQISIIFSNPKYRVFKTACQQNEVSMSGVLEKLAMQWVEGKIKYRKVV